MSAKYQPFYSGLKGVTNKIYFTEPHIEYWPTTLLHTVGALLSFVVEHLWSILPCLSKSVHWIRIYLTSRHATCNRILIVQITDMISFLIRDSFVIRILFMTPHHTAWILCNRISFSMSSLRSHESVTTDPFCGRKQALEFLTCTKLYKHVTLRSVIRGTGA